MARMMAAFAGLRGLGATFGPYVLLAVIVPGGFALAPLLYWRNHRQPQAPGIDPR
jgi:hypothetical protein